MDERQGVSPWSLVWLPSVAQEVFLPNEVRSSAVLCQAFVCGTDISRMAGMVISGSGPNLRSELIGSMSPTGFTVPDQSIMRPFGSSTSHTSLPRLPMQGQWHLRLPQPWPVLDNPPFWSTWPISSGPSCLPKRLRPAYAVSWPASAKANYRPGAVCDLPNSPVPWPR